MPDYSSPKAPPKGGDHISRYREFRAKRPKAVGMLIEGDSWFDYPMIVSTNITDQLKKTFRDKIVHLPAAHSGDDAREMLCGKQFAYLFKVMAEEKLSFDCILFSGGGNDIVAQNLPVLLNYYQPGMTWEDCLNMPRFKRRLQEIENVYLDLADLRDDYQPSAWIFTHGYDYAIPTGEGFKVLGVTVAGKWIKARMASKDIPETFQRKILDHMLSEFDNMLIKLEQTIPRCVHVRTQGTLKDNEWANELHPTTAGFQKITAKFKETLETVFPQLV